MTKASKVLGAFCIAALFQACLAVSANAHNFTPNILTDENVHNVNCSLREAIIAANTDGNHNGCAGTDDAADSIDLAAGSTYSLTIDNTDDAGALGDLDVFGENLTIQTIGNGRATIDGAGVADDRVLDVGSGSATAITVAINDVIIENGKGVDGGNLRNGNLAISTLTLTDSIVRNNNNTATTIGGGISNTASALTLVDSTVSGNTVVGASSSGGGIEDTGSVTLTRSTVSDNHANLATASGGGIHATGAAVNVNNSTISGNTAGGNGGGIDGAAILKNATVTNNTADLDGGTAAQGSGGVTTVTAHNSIIAGNIDGSPVINTPDCTTIIGGSSFDLIGNTAGCTVGGTNHLSNISAMLDPLTIANGGQTATHALQATSQAINTGNPATPDGTGTNCFATDQRGLPRGGAAGVCDRGAFEVQPPPTTPTPPVATPTTPTTTPTVAAPPKKKCKKKKRAGAAKKCKKKK